MRTRISPLECRTLSELLRYGGDGVSATTLASWAETSRSVLYVLLHRLHRMKCVSKRRARVPGRNEYQVLYRATPTGRKALERFARDVGLSGATP